MERKTFILHDESVNTHGFRMLTSGCDLSVFRANPVMFYNHDDWNLPIGRWEDIRVEGDQILAEAVFDMEDERARGIASKISKGFLKAASIGAWVHESTDAPELRLEGQTGRTVTRWTAREASICPIGANHHAVALYDGENRRVELSGLPAQALPAVAPPRLVTACEMTEENRLNKEGEMFNLRKMFKLNESATEEAVAEEVRKLMDANASLEKENAELRAANARLQTEKREREAAEKSARAKAALKLVDAAISEGRISGSSRASWLQSFESDYEGSQERLESVPRRQSIASQLDRGATGQGLSGKTWDELDRSGKLQELRDTDPAAYAEKYEAKFGVKPPVE